MSIKILSHPTLAAGSVLAAVAIGAFIPTPASALTPAQRQTYVDSGQYAADLQAAIDPAKQWIVRRAAQTSAQTKLCRAAGLRVGQADPGPDPNADYKVPAVEDPAPVASARVIHATTATTLTAQQRAAAKRRAAAAKKAAARKKAAAKRKKPVKKPVKPKPTPVKPAPAKTVTVTVTTPTPAPVVTPPVTVTTPAPPAQTVTTPAPPPQFVTVTTPAPPVPTVTAADCAQVEKLAIGFDIDETAFSNYGVGSATPNYADTWSLHNQALGTSVALQPVLDLYKLARRYDVSAFFLTARFDPILADPNNKALFLAGALCAPPYDAIGLCGIDLTTYDYRSLTLNNLRSAGYTDAAGLYMRPEGSTDKGVVKAAQRAELERRRGFDVIAMVGDNGSDIAGGFYDKGFKIPTLD